MGRENEPKNVHFCKMDDLASFLQKRTFFSHSLHNPIDFRHTFVALPNILGDGCVKEVWILADNGDVVAEVSNVCGGDVVCSN
jgi:hypothetical protein